MPKCPPEITDELVLMAAKFTLEHLDTVDDLTAEKLDLPKGILLGNLIDRVRVLLLKKANRSGSSLLQSGVGNNKKSQTLKSADNQNGHRSWTSLPSPRRGGSCVK